MGRARTLLLSLAGIALLACGSETETGGDTPADTNASAPLPTKKQTGARPPAFDAQFTDTPGDPPSKTPPPSSSCLDEKDPGGSEVSATQLPDTDDCDEDYKVVNGVSKSAVDVDFYKLSGTDRAISFSHPLGCAIDADFEVQAPNTELCVFARCKNATVNSVIGCDAGTSAQSDTGIWGCCATNGHATPQWKCDDVLDNDSADFFLRVRQVGANECRPYTLRYRF